MGSWCSFLAGVWTEELLEPWTVFRPCRPALAWVGPGRRHRCLLPWGLQSRRPAALPIPCSLGFLGWSDVPFGALLPAGASAAESLAGVWPGFGTVS